MKETRARIAALSLVACSAVATGCSILSPQADTSHFFILAPLPDATQPNGSKSDALPNLLLGLGPIKLPPYLDRNEIALRLSPTQVTYSAADRWAEPLSINLSRVLSQNLSLLLGTERIVQYPWSNAAKIDYQIQVEVLSFEATQAGEARLAARYGILQGRTRQPLVVREANVSRKTAPDTATSVTALSATLGDLSQEIASAVRQLPKPPEAPSPARKRP